MQDNTVRVTRWVLAGLIAVGCALPLAASDKRDWERAEKLDTIDAYEALIRKGNRLAIKYQVAASNRLRVLYFERAQSIDTLDHWRSYLKQTVCYGSEEDRDCWQRVAVAKEAEARMVGEQVRAAQRALLPKPTWDGFSRFWEQYTADNSGGAAVDLPQLRFELAVAHYRENYPKTELTGRLEHNLVVRQFAANPGLWSAIAYLRAYPQGEQRARMAAYVEADTATVRVGDLRIEWISGQVRDVMREATGEMLFRSESLEPVYVTRRPRRSSFLIADFLVYNLGQSRSLTAANVSLRDGAQRSYGADSVRPAPIALPDGLSIISMTSNVTLDGVSVSVRAIFDVPKAGLSSLRLYIDGQPTLRVADMPRKTGVR